MQPDLFSVPAFNRIADYIGLWAIADHVVPGLQAAAQIVLADFAAHAEAHQKQLASTIEPVAATEKIATPGGKSIAVIRAQGLLMKGQSSMGGTSTVQMRRDIRQAAADSDIAGILLAADSPGGTVSGTDDLAAEVRAAKKQKPVWCHVDDLCASAAYWMASQADRITANSSTALVGSIGTIQVIQDISAAAENEGVKTLVFATGPLKGLGTPGTKVTDEQIAHVQGLVNSVQSSFDAAVQKGRGLSAKELAAVRHGGVMTAQDAMDAKLIDAIQPLSKTLSDFSKSFDNRKQNAGASGGGLFSNVPALFAGQGR